MPDAGLTHDPLLCKSYALPTEPAGPTILPITTLQILLWLILLFLLFLLFFSLFFLIIIIIFFFRIPIDIARWISSIESWEFRTDWNPVSFQISQTCFALKTSYFPKSIVFVGFGRFPLNSSREDRYYLIRRKICHFVSSYAYKNLFWTSLGSCIILHHLEFNEVYHSLWLNELRIICKIVIYMSFGQLNLIF